MPVPLVAPPRFGANYTPSRGWFHHWLDFNPSEVKEDLGKLAELGLDHLRVFALWTLFQPNRTLIRQSALDDLAKMVEIAGDLGLDVSVDGLQGHLSSFDFVPSWAATWHEANLITDPRVIEGQSSYLRAIAERLKSHPNFLGTSIGNEFSQFTWSAHPTRSVATVDQAEEWMRTMIEASAEGAPDAEHHHSEFDASFFDSAHPFTPELAANIGARTTIHSWVFNNTAQTYGGMSEQAFLLPVYLMELGRAYAKDPHRQIWLQEIGAPSPHVSAADAPEFMRRTLDYALDTQDLYGVTWWCSHDVDRALADFPDLEYSLGLLANNNEIKAQGAVFKEFAERRQQLTTPAPRETALILELEDERQGLGRETCKPGGKFFDAWMELAMRGERPTVVLASQAENAGYLAARGITATQSMHHLKTPQNGATVAHA